MTVQAQIEELARSKLLGRRIDALSFVDELLRLAQETGEVHCSAPAGDRLHFVIAAEHPGFEVEVDAAVGKLRMMCARLAKLCQESGQEFHPYGGEGTITNAAVLARLATVAAAPALAHPQGGAAAIDGNGSRQRWSVRYKNTMYEQEFTIAKVDE